MLGIAVKRYVLGAVVFRDGIEEAHDTSVNKVVQVHVNRQVFVNANGNRLDQRKVIEHDLIALFLRNVRLADCRHTDCVHVPVLFFLSLFSEAGSSSDAA